MLTSKDQRRSNDLGDYSAYEEHSIISLDTAHIHLTPLGYQDDIGGSAPNIQVQKHRHMGVKLTRQPPS